MFKNMKLSIARAWVKRFKQHTVLRTRALYRIGTELKNNNPMFYWDYRDNWSESQLKKIEEDGQEGYYQLVDKLIENNHDYAYDLEKNQRVELFNGVTIEDFEPAWLQEQKKHYIGVGMLDEDCEMEEVFAYSRDELSEHNELNDMLRELQEVDYCIDDIGMPNYNKTLWFEFEVDEFMDFILEDIKKYESENGVELVLIEEKIYLKWDSSITDIDDIVHAHSITDAEFNRVKFYIKEITLQDEDGDQHDIKINKEFSYYNASLFFEDDDYCENDQWNLVLEMDIDTINDKQKRVFHRAFKYIPEFNTAADKTVAKFKIDGMLIIEKSRISESSFRVMALREDTGVWLETYISILDFTFGKKRYIGKEIDLDGQFIEAA